MRIQATDASRGFSRLLSRAAAGEVIEIDRHGEVVALLTPPPRAFVRGEALLDLLHRRPQPDEGFAADVAAIASVTVPPGARAG